MSEVLLSALIFVPIVIALLSSLLAWRALKRPFLFFAVSALALLGLQAIISPVAIGVFLTPDASLSRASAHEAFVSSVVTAAVAVAALGCPLLWWLFKGLSRGA